MNILAILVVAGGLVAKCGRVAVFAALVLTTSGAGAENCKPTDDEVAAQTAKCLVSIDNNLLVNERCNVGVSPDGREVDFDAGKYYARISLTLDRKGAPTILTASWNHGSGRSDQLASLGLVTAFERGSATCWRNRRVEMCMSDYITCDCKAGEEYHCAPID